MNNLVQPGKFELKSAVSKRWYIHNVKESMISRVPLFGGHPECRFLDAKLQLDTCNKYIPIIRFPLMSLIAGQRFTYPGM